MNYPGRPRCPLTNTEVLMHSSKSSTLASVGARSLRLVYVLPLLLSMRIILLRQVVLTAGIDGDKRGHSGQPHPVDRLRAEVLTYDRLHALDHASVQRTEAADGRQVH